MRPKAAVEEGIVPGGGVALLRCVKGLDSLKLEHDQQVGADIVRRAIESPMRTTIPACRSNPSTVA